MKYETGRIPASFDKRHPRIKSIISLSRKREHFLSLTAGVPNPKSFERSESEVYAFLKAARTNLMKEFRETGRNLERATLKTRRQIKQLHKIPKLRKALLVVSPDKYTKFFWPNEVVHREMPPQPRTEPETKEKTYRKGYELVMSESTRTLGAVNRASKLRGLLNSAEIGNNI